MTFETEHLRAGYDCAPDHPWFEPTDYDWLLEAAAAACIVLGALTLLV